MRGRCAFAVAAIVMFVAVGGLAIGCGQSARAPIGERPVEVVATTNFLADMAREIGGPRTRVSSLMGPGVDPHSYKASASDVKTLRDADLLLNVGLQLEGRMGDWFEEMSRRTMVVSVTSDIPRGDLLASPDYEDQYDPHVWFDVPMWSSAVGTIERALTRADPAGAREYAARADEYRRRLRALDREARSTLAAIPPRQRILVTSHDAFAYLGRRYGLRVEGIQGISTVAEATTGDIERVADAVAANDLPSVFIESSVSPQTMRAVAEAAGRKGHDVKIGPELFADSAGGASSPEGTYIGMVRANIRRIAAGLSQ
ncbi:MAG: zinc ABC transporter substrate-binding protein [Actinomycetota bacterium]|nr:zinc ABC transporter substrate-binding protein [Thermoleophilia bacterium]MDA3005745.1 zinc ABC transporter substrate-binding protein [Actinomycetota bacterium]